MSERRPRLLARFDEELRSRHAVPRLIGVDEAGRGPLAGPVVAAAVVLDPRSLEELEPVRDSKALSPAKRAVLFDAIRRRALGVAVGWASPEEIDRRNILRATFDAMRRALVRLESGGGLVAVDGNLPIPDCPLPQIPIVGGDALSLSIACASVVAKVVRDRWMTVLDRRFPGYGLAGHKGYGTEAHMEALARLGPSSIHRRSFAPVARAVPVRSA